MKVQIVACSNFIHSVSHNKLNKLLLLKLQIGRYVEFHPMYQLEILFVEIYMFEQN